METRTTSVPLPLSRVLLGLVAVSALLTSLLIISNPVRAAVESSSVACNNIVNGGRSPSYVWTTTDSSGLTVHWSQEADKFGTDGTVTVRACVDIDGDLATDGDQAGGISQDTANDGSEFFPWSLFALNADPCPSDASFGGSVDSPAVQTKKSNMVDCGRADEDHASLNVKKENENGKGLAGAVFTVEGMEGTFTTGEDGKFCITGLPKDSVWLVTEIQAPAGYVIADPASQMVEVDNDGDCDSADAHFVNTLATPTPTPTPEGSVAGGTSTPTPTTEGSVQGGTGTPAPSQPDTAMGALGAPGAVPTIAFALILLAALGTLAWANVKARSRS